MEQTFLADGGQFEEITIDSIFKHFPLKKLNPLDSREFRVQIQDENHPIPAVVAKVGNNGVMYFVGKNDYETTKNKLVVIGDGAVASGLVYYQEKEFTILHNAYAIQLKYPEFENRHIYLYLQASVQKAIFQNFGYENKPTWEKVKLRKIILPIQNGEIAFDYMERIVQQLRAERAKELRAERAKELRAFLKLSNLTDVNLSKDEENALNLLSGSLNWQPFNLKDLFGAATRGKRLKSTDRISGSLPFVTAGEANTGISDFIGNPVTKFKANTVTIDMFGSAKYRNYEYGADDHVAVVHSQIWQKHAVLFLTAAIHKVANTGQFSYSRNFYAKDADELNILLPEKNGKPNTDLMAQIGRAIEKLVIADVVQFNECELAAYESVVQ